VLLYVKRWLAAPLQQSDGTLIERHRGTPQGSSVSPVLANLFLHYAFDMWLAREHPTVVFERYADDAVVHCGTRQEAERVLEAIAGRMSQVGLALHPDKTKIVDLREGREGFDFLGCHFRARFSGRSWEKYGTVRFYLHRWPSQAAMKKLRSKVRERTGRRRSGADIRHVIADVNPILRGWGNYFRSGNAAAKFQQVDDYVVFRLRRLMVKKRGRNLRAGQADQWTREWFEGHGLCRLRGTIRYPKAA
jgi:RNA-directed DNA polymerase